MKEARFKINYTPHSGQVEVLRGIIDSLADVIVIVAARGWGKTLFSTCNIVVPAMLKIPHCQVMWVAPTYKICKAPIDDVWNGVNEKNGERYIPQVDEKTGYKFWDYKKADMELHLFNESKMFMRSAENPNSIVAKGYNLIVIDEAALMSKEVFMQHILPTARRAGCKIVIITTPRGRNWVFELFKDGQDDSKKAYYSTRQPWFKRPDYPELLKRLMLDTPEHIRRQEYYAEFLEGGAGTFKNLDAIFKGMPINFPMDQQQWYTQVDPDRFSKELFVIGADFAKSSDYTVLTAFGQQKRDMVGYERMNKTDYKIVLERIRQMSKKFGNAEVIFDNTGVGSGLADFLAGDLNVHPFTLTNQSKNEIINKLIVSCDYAKLSMPNIVTVRNEFELFTYELTRTGKLSYNAPDGKHDDTVISVALSNWFAEESSGSTEVHTLDNFFQVMQDTRRPKSFYDEMAEDND
jgi:hypothetical protein